MTDPSHDQCVASAEERARKCYSELHRHHHDQNHLDECLVELDWLHGLAARERKIIKWAVLWHDAVYVPGRSDNEERSAELASSELTACGIAAEDVAEVARLIRLTERHQAYPGDRLGTLIVSIDLSILGSDPQRYRAYAANVRREFASLSDDEWKSERAEELDRLLSLNPIFPDAEFRKRLESQARRNLESELKALREG